MTRIEEHRSPMAAIKQNAKALFADQLGPLWEEAHADTTSGIPMVAMLDRLERKYQELADSEATEK